MTNPCKVQVVGDGYKLDGTGARVRGSWSDPGVSLAPTTVKMPDEKRDLVYQHCFKILVGSFRTEHIHSWV